MVIEGSRDTRPFDPIDYWSRRVHGNSTISDTGASGFSLHYNQLLYRLKQRAFGSLLSAFDRSLRGGRVLNVGCGTGYFENFFEKQFQMLPDGLDVSPTTIERLQRENPARHYRVWDLADGICPDLGRDYQLLTFIDVLYHVVDDERWERSLINGLRHLRTGGLLLLTDIAGGQARCGGIHVRFRSYEQYDDVLRAQGCQPLESTNMYYLFNRFKGFWSKVGWAKGRAMFLVDCLVASRVKTNNMQALLWRKERD